MSGLMFLALSMIAEGFVVLVIAGLLTILNRSFGYSYQKYWALSWYAYAIYLALTGLTLSSYARSVHLGDWQYAVSVTTQFAGYLKTYFLLIGTLILSGKATPPTFRIHIFWAIGIAITSILMVSLFDESGSRAERYFTRVSLPHCIYGIVSIYCAYFIYRRINNITGAKLFALCLTAHGLVQQVLFLQGLNYLIFENRPPNFNTLYAFTDILVLICLTFSLVAWSVANEKEKVSRTEEKLKSMALHDGLTGLANRLWLETLFPDQFACMTRQYKGIAFVFIDLDKFKAVNDSFGHHRGDLMLKAASDALKEFASDEDVICRFGGDEFIWVIPYSTKKASALRRVEQFRQSVEKIRLDENNQEISISCSIGIARYPQDGKEISELIQLSDQALYRAKREGKNRMAMQ